MGHRRTYLALPDIRHSAKTYRFSSLSRCHARGERPLPVSSETSLGSFPSRADLVVVHWMDARSSKYKSTSSETLGQIRFILDLLRVAIIGRDRLLGKPPPLVSDIWRHSVEHQ